MTIKISELLRQVRNIGHEYMKLYPRWHLFHNNQEVAGILKEYQANDEEQAWIGLRNIYAFLPNANGFIAKKIANLFEQNFGDTYTAHGETPDFVPFEAFSFQQYYLGKMNRCLTTNWPKCCVNQQRLAL